MKIAIIGLGLIGGSIALDLRKRQWATTILGVDKNPKHSRKALELGIVDEVVPLRNAIQHADLIILAVPVNVMCQLVAPILNEINAESILIDVGSTKGKICIEADSHPNRGNFVACHPLAGTENTGPEAAIHELFDGKVNIICEAEKSHLWAVEKVEALFEKGLNMRNIFMDPTEHDRHIAYVSHLSHISSFTLGLTVLEIEKNEKHIFNMASTGFASTVRLAKSSPKMWTPIFEENTENLSQALDAYIGQLQYFKKLLDEGQFEAIYRLIENANDIRRILEGIELKNIAFATTK